MRFSEPANLRIADIDSPRMQIRITHGKGAKQRQVPLSPRLLQELRDYWKQCKPASLLFPGNSVDKTYADTTIQKTIKASALAAGIKKDITPHTLRSQCAADAKQYAGGGACFQVREVLAKLSLCRTRALGGKSYQCDECGALTEVFHSCSDRHCPQCSGCKRYDFALRAEELILAGVTYYQVVFTLPHECRSWRLLTASRWRTCCSRRQRPVCARRFAANKTMIPRR